MPSDPRPPTPRLIVQDRAVAAGVAAAGPHIPPRDGARSGPAEQERRPRRRPQLVWNAEQLSAQEETCRFLPADQIRLRELAGDGVMPMRCMRWRCDDCGPWMKWRLTKAIEAAAADRPQLRRFFTLTLLGDARQLPLERRYELIQHAWTKLARRLARRLPGGFEFIKVVEPHKDGTPHIHGLAGRFIPLGLLSALWEECGGGMVDIRFVDPQRVAAYLAKYMAKNVGAPPRGMRKYSAGGGVALDGVRPKGDGGWHIEIRVGGRFGWMAVTSAGPDIARISAQQIRDGRADRPPDDLAGQLQLAILTGWAPKAPPKRSYQAGLLQ